MRRYVAAPLLCLTCGKPVRLVFKDGGWSHVDKVGIKDPAWHLPKVA